jgi:hypothetical protein
MPTRTRIRGRGTVDWPEHELHGAKVDLIGNAPGGRLLLRVREPHATYGMGARVLVPAARFKQDPP